MKLEDIQIGEIYVVEYSSSHIREFKVIAIEDDIVVCWGVRSKSPFTFKPEELRPIKTPAETLREETIKAAENTCYRSEGFTFCEALYDEGMLVKPMKKINFEKFHEFWLRKATIYNVYDSLKPYMNTED